MVVAGLGGCAIAPDLGVRPEPAQPSAFASDRSLAGTSPNWPTASWWQDLGDRQLDGLVRDRKRAVSGKSVSVRVELGGRRIITNKIPDSGAQACMESIARAL